MPAALSQEEREQQIHALCENTIYSFVGWDGEYKNNKSKFILKCNKHSVQSISLNNFLSGKSRCVTCRYEKSRKTNSRTENQTITMLTQRGFKFLRWKDSYVNQYSVAIFRCEVHGEYETKLINALLKNAKCQKCSGAYRWTQEEREQQVIDKNENYTFLGWVNGYVNNISRIKMQCESGHQWDTSLANYVNSLNGCPRCGGSFRYEEHELLNKINLSLKEGIRFFKWVSDYGTQSKAIFECDLHGQWITTVGCILYENSGCPACATTGYNPYIHGYLYALRSRCGSFIKIGISNKVESRFRTLRKKTPFEFDVVESIRFENGADARQWEKIFHEAFTSACLTGFDGSTEWLKWTPEIQGWFRFLN